MTEPLVDAEDFPLPHVDVYQVRHARQRIICLQNDHKALMKRIEAGLQGYYSSTSDNANSNDVEMHERPPLSVHRTPFARVESVAPRSPAEFCVRSLNRSLYSENFLKDIGTYFLKEIQIFEGFGSERSARGTRLGQRLELHGDDQRSDGRPALGRPKSQRESPEGRSRRHLDSRPEKMDGTRTFGLQHRPNSLNFTFIFFRFKT